MAFYFGTQGNLKSVKVPTTGLDRASTSFRTSGILTNGGGYARSSVASHYLYNINWDFIRNDQYAEIRELFDYNELIHFLDPQAAVTNSLPPYVAQAGDAARGGYRLVGYSGTTAIAEASTLAPEITTGPKRTAAYTGLTGAPRKQIWLPIPTGYTLWLRGLTSGSASVQVGSALLDHVSAGLPGLDKWYSTMQTKARPQIVAIGDSIVEGSGASTVNNRWLSKVQTALAPSGPAMHYIAAAPASPVSGWPATWSGATSTNPSWGLGIRTRLLTDATSTLTFTFNGTSATLMYLRTASTGIMSITVDGGTPIAVDTLLSPSNLAGTWSTGALAAGDHTIVVKRDAASLAGRSVYIEGLLAYKGDLTNGIRTLDAAHAGFSSSDTVSGSRLTAQADAIVAAGGADLLVISLLNNDFSQNVPRATYRTNILNIISTLRARNTAASVLLLGMSRQAGANATLWQEYHDVLKSVADEVSDVAYLDMRDYLADADSAPSLYADGVHPNDAGYTIMANAIKDVVDSTPSVPMSIPQVSVPAGTAQGAYLTISDGDNISIRWLQSKVLPTGQTPDWSAGWKPGLGHSGCRLDADPAYTLYSAPQAIDYGALSLSLRETGAWE